MNCKPGDLAIIINGECVPEVVGHFVTVLSETRPGDSHDFEIGDWNCQPLAPIGGYLSGLEGSPIFDMSQIAINDKNLRPIRPQSDDAVDEVIRRVGKPKQAERDSELARLTLKYGEKA